MRFRKVKRKKISERLKNNRRTKEIKFTYFIKKKNIEPSNPIQNKEETECQTHKPKKKIIKNSRTFWAKQSCYQQKHLYVNVNTVIHNEQ